MQYGDELAATALLKDFAGGALSPLEALDSTLERIAREDPAVNAFRLVDADRAREAAARSQARWSRGEPAGLLDGVPVAIKDVLLTAGWPTLRGSRAVDPDRAWDVDARPSRHSPATAPWPSARRRRRSSAGRASPTARSTASRAIRGTSRGRRAGQRRQLGGARRRDGAARPRHRRRRVDPDPVRLLRAPRDQADVRPRARVAPSPFGILAHVGPMARTVRDVALLLDVLTEPDVRDWTALEPEATPYREALGGGVEGLRVAFSPTLGYAAVEPEVAAIVARAAGRLEDLGAYVEEVDPGFPDPRGTFETLWFAGAGRVVADLGDPPPTDVLDPGLVRTAAMGSRITAMEYLGAMQARDALGLRMSEFHASWDLLVTPTLPLPAFEAGADVPAGSSDPDWTSWTPFTFPFNLTQQPAGTVPCGFTSAGLPVGLQIVGPRYRDALVLRAMAAYEAAHPEPTVSSRSA